MSEKVKMRLLKRHTHNGADLQPPAVIEVPSHKVNWLVDQGIAEKFVEQSPSHKHHSR